MSGLPGPSVGLLPAPCCADWLVSPPPLPTFGWAHPFVSLAPQDGEGAPQDRKGAALGGECSPGWREGSPGWRGGSPSGDGQCGACFRHPCGALLLAPLLGLAVCPAAPWGGQRPSVCVPTPSHPHSRGTACPRGRVPRLMDTWCKYIFVSGFTKAAALSSFPTESETWLVTGACGFSVLLPARFLTWAALGRARPTSLSLAARHSALVWALLTKLPGRKPAFPTRLDTRTVPPGCRELTMCGCGQRGRDVWKVPLCQVSERKAGRVGGEPCRGS